MTGVHFSDNCRPEEQLLWSEAVGFGRFVYSNINLMPVTIANLFVSLLFVHSLFIVLCSINRTGPKFHTLWSKQDLSELIELSRNFRL